MTAWTRMTIGILLALAISPAAASGQQTAQGAPAAEGHVHEEGRAGDAEGQKAPAADETDHSAHERGVASPHPGIPPVTDADRAAAFPDVEGHGLHDTALNYFVLFDQLEWQSNDGGRGASWDTKGWMGGDLHRLWFRTEGDAADDRLAMAQAHLLYGRAIAPWWDLVVGVRQDLRPGSPQTWAAAGIQGTAPYWFEVQATAYLGASGRTHFRFEGEYELLLTNRLILQPLAETEIYGKSDPEHGFGAGLATLDAGLRLRYEIRRELAPYAGLVWSRKFFGTADLAEAAGERPAGARLALGVRLWF